MNQVQAARLLDLGLTQVARYDARANRLAIWHRPNRMVTGLAPWASDQAARQALWGQGLTGVAAREVTTNLFAGALTIAIPLPAGGWVVGVVEHRLIQQEAAALADELEKAVKREFGQTLAPLVTVGIAFVLVAALLYVLAEG